MTSSSDSLLAQILIIVNEVQASISVFEAQLTETKEVIEALNQRIDSVIEAGFPRGDLNNHRQWHEATALPAWKRALLKLILK